MTFCFVTSTIQPTEGAKVGGYYFCTNFPGFPECSGWRTEPIMDNYWFCDYVNLKSLCKNPPNPEKQIQLRTTEYCCRHIGSESESLKQNIKIKESGQTVLPIQTTKSISPLIIWTDKDHYNYRDKVIVYGKFDFTDPTIIQNIGHPEFEQTGEMIEESFTIDVDLNGRTVLRHIPVNPENGWFSAYFFQNNIYTFSTQNNLLEVDYIITSKDLPPGGPKTHAIYEFTTGDVAKRDNSFEVWVDESLMPEKLRYGVIVEDAERFIDLSRLDLVTTRLITPEGYAIPIKSAFSGEDISTEYEGFSEYGYGKYEIQVTYGDNTSKKVFEYKK